MTNTQINCPSSDSRCEEGKTETDDKIGANQAEIKEMQEEYDVMRKRHDQEQYDLWEKIQELIDETSELED